MINTKRIKSDDGQSVGWSVIILWLFSVTLTYTIERGDHANIGVCVGPIEATFGLSVWRKLLP